MSPSPHTTIVSGPTTPEAQVCLGNDPQPLSEVSATYLMGDRLFVAEAMSLLIRLDQDLREARAQFNQDWFRRIMRARYSAVLRLRRRWSKLVSDPPVPLGKLRRRYHANIARYLY